jgi:phage terminase small subunit
MPTKADKFSHISADQPLTRKQQKFVSAYTSTSLFNGKESAREAGYKGNDHTLTQVGSENLSKPHIKAAISKIMERDAMGEREVRARLAAQARADIGQIIDLSDPNAPKLDLEKAKRLGFTKNLRKVKTTTKKGRKGQSSVIVEAELYSSQDALDKMARILGLYKDKTLLTVEERSPITPEIMAQMTPDELEILEQARAIVAKYTAER